MTHPASRFLYAVRHAQPYTEEGAAAYWRFLVKEASAILYRRGAVYRRVVTEWDIEDAASAYMARMLDLTTYPAWAADDEATLWRKMVNDYCLKFLRAGGNAIVYEGRQQECSTAQQPDDEQQDDGEWPEDHSDSAVATGDLEDVGKYFLPSAADAQKARDIFLSCLGCYRRSEWLVSDQHSLAKHVLLFYAHYDWLSLRASGTSAKGTAARQALERRYGIDQKDLATILGLSSAARASILKRKAEEQYRPDPEGAVTPVDEDKLLIMTRRLDRILADRY